MNSVLRSYAARARLALSIPGTRGFAGKLSVQNVHTERQIPEPRLYKGELETVETFLRKIGRDAVKYKDKFGSWGELFTATPEQMKEKGLTVQARRYVAMWTQRYRRGEAPHLMPSTKKERLARKAATKSK